MAINFCNHFISFIDDICLQWGSSSIEVWQSLKSFYHSYDWIRLKVSFPNAVFNISNVPVKDFPNLTHKFIAHEFTCFKSNKNCETCLTLVDTDIARWLSKIMWWGFRWVISQVLLYNLSSWYCIFIWTIIREHFATQHCYYIINLQQVNPFCSLHTCVLW